MRHCRKWCLIKVYAVCSALSVWIHTVKLHMTLDTVDTDMDSGWSFYNLLKLLPKYSDTFTPHHTCPTKGINITLSAGLSLLVSIFYLMEYKWEPEASSHRTRLYFFLYQLICLKCTDEIANSVDPDQTAPKGAVWSGSTLFTQASLSEYLG